MCGIVYAHDFAGNPVNNGILNQFDKQRSRGTQGFGLFDGKEGNIVKASNEDKILKWLATYDSNLLLFHHRWPTSTPNTKRTAHPFTTGDYFGDNEYILVHNGHISNCYMLKYDHEDLGIKYRGTADKGKFNDSESLLWDLSLYLEGKQDKVKAYGGMAFVCIRLHKGKLDKLYFGRNTYPLKMLKVKKGIMLSSEGPGFPIEPDTLYTWNYQLKRLTNRKVVFPNWKGANTPAVPYKPPQSTVERAIEEVREDNELDREYDFSEYEVDNYILRYLILADGNFQKAYDAMDADSLKLEGIETEACIREKNLIWEAMDVLEADTEWENQYSICSLFVKEDKEVKDGNTLQLPLPA